MEPSENATAQTFVPQAESTANGAPVDMLFRQAMSRLAAGVVMVTCHLDERPWGMTATACCSISVDPPSILVSLRESTVSARRIDETGRFGVSVLGSAALKAAEFGSRPGQPKFIDDYCLPDDAAASATPIVAQAQAHIDCTVTQTHRVGDHMLFIGDARSVVLHSADRPLVYYLKDYRGLTTLIDGDTAVVSAASSPDGHPPNGLERFALIDGRA